MIMKSVIIPVVSLMITMAVITKAYSQITYSLYEEYKINGTVKDALTKEPISATLIFQSVPDASDIYIIDAASGSGSYEVIIRNKKRYIIEITSNNYKPEIDTVTIKGNINALDFDLLSVKPGQLLRLHNIYFAQGDYRILEKSRREISELVLLLNQYPDMSIQLEGHTDRLGGRNANVELSENRVQEIKKSLVSSGVNHKRIKTRAFGGSKPISTENNEESRQLNRRVEVRILSI